MTYVAAIDMVSEGLATAHTPLSLLPSLPASVRSRLRVYALPNMDRSIVLAMPKHLMTLPGYANIFRRLTDFCRNEYGQNVPAEDILELPSSMPAKPEREAAEARRPSAGQPQNVQ
jgi:hypothetical protein